MGLELIMSQNLELAEKLEVSVTDGNTHSLFVKTEEKLNEIEYQKALEYVAKKKNMSKYRDMIDFLFCELFQQWKNPCFKFYEEEGPRLKDHLIIPQVIKSYDEVLSNVALEIAKLIMEQQRREFWWVQFNLKVHQVLRLNNVKARWMES